MCCMEYAFGRYQYNEAQDELFKLESLHYWVNVDLRVYIAELMLTWVDPMDKTIVSPICGPFEECHYPVHVKPLSPNWRRGVIWGLEPSICKNLQVLMLDTCDRLSNFMAMRLIPNAEIF